MELTEYEPGTAFPGMIGRTTDESNPAWPRPLRARPGTPNVLIIMLDDTGQGQLAAHEDFPVTTPIIFNPDGLTCGANPGNAITPDYQPPFRFTSTLHTVTHDLSGDLITDTEAEIRVAMARQ
jgi:hypothetical protein